MMWALLLLFGVIVGVHWWEYQNSVREYTFAQPANITELGSVITEKTPVAIEVGALPWRPEIAEKTATAETIGLTTGLSELADARAWWWLPGLYAPVLGQLEKSQVIGLSWINAERQWIGCSHGGPMTVWLVHTRYRRYLPTGTTIDPWTLTVADAPWIGRVQYVEVAVKPGWCLGIPAHWGYAVRAEEAAWWWRVDQHSALSLSLDMAPHLLSALAADDETGDDDGVGNEEEAPAA
jgi:hypothetical protein